jgi:hypothetical protein
VLNPSPSVKLLVESAERMQGVREQERENSLRPTQFVTSGRQRTIFETLTLP